MEDVVDNANNDIAEQEESTGSVSSPLFSVNKPNKRLRSKGRPWAECMRCHRVFNCTGATGTTGLRNHLAKCRPGTRRRPRQQELSADMNTKNQSDGEIASPEQKDIPTDTSQKNQEIDQDGSHEELIGILAMHGHLPRMTEQDGFRKLVAWLNPTVKVSSHCDLMVNTQNLFQKEKSKLKENLTSLCSRVCLSVYMWHYDPVLAFLCLRVHYINHEWEKQEEVIAFRAVDSSCNAKELSDIISGAIGQWGLHGKIFSIILDDAFIDDSVASNVKAILQEWNPLAANRSLFVVLDQVIQVGLDELDKMFQACKPSYPFSSTVSQLQICTINGSVGNSKKNL
ncbi:zinc finger BED domain-containing protein RICESLEEPER 2-like [Phragmites australis]|uniref:zinc finger BED domain-containing protein RICESLEEPER 2-like n=1 Tax=Phragmites australis TaxID=29695 RepID=UPI002D796758|nr:zinc finger BED domain-containing protein RICESLEEPER 2-like [Phragmites australis]